MPDAPSPPDPLGRARVVAVYVVLVLIAASVALDLVDEASHLDVGVFATLAGILLALLGIEGLRKVITVTRKP